MSMHPSIEDKLKEPKNEPPMLEFTLEEAQALNRILFHQYISYEDPEAQAVAAKLYRWLVSQGVL